MAKKRTNLYLGTEGGRAKYETFYYETQEELEAEKIRIKSDRQKGKDLLSNPRFEPWAEKWIERKAETCSPGTLQMYRAAVNHLEAAFGRKKFIDIRFFMFEDYIREFSKRPLQRTGKVPSRATLKNLVKCYNGIATLAKMNGIPGAQPFEGVRIPREAPVLERRALSLEELQWIEETPDYASEIHGEPPRAQCAVMLMCFAGLRRGELIPLTWADVDLDRGLIDVKKSVSIDEQGRNILKEGGKSAAAVRRIPIPGVLVEYLKKYKSTGSLNSVFVCSQRDGSMHTGTSFTRMWKDYHQYLIFKYVYGEKIDNLPEEMRPQQNDERQDLYHCRPYRNIRIKKTDEHYFTAHYCRHFFATMLYVQGIPAEISMHILGHSSISVTLDTYTHIRGDFEIFDLPEVLQKRLESDFKVEAS